MIMEVTLHLSAVHLFSVLGIQNHKQLDGLKKFKGYSVILTLLLLDEEGNICFTFPLWKLYTIISKSCISFIINYCTLLTHWFQIDPGGPEVANRKKYCEVILKIKTATF